MASFTTTSFDLLALHGAKLLNVDDTISIVIPCKKNNITINQGQRRQYANLPVAVWPKRDVQHDLDWRNQQRAQRGDEPLTIDKMPTHDMKVNFTTDFIVEQIKKFQKPDGTNPLVQGVLSNMTEDRRNRLKDLDPLDTTSGLYYAIRDHYNIRLAEMYARVPQASSQPTVAQQVSGYTPVTDEQMTQYDDDIENPDLPF